MNTADSTQKNAAQLGTSQAGLGMLLNRKAAVCSGVLLSAIGRGGNGIRARLKSWIMRVRVPPPGPNKIFILNEIYSAVLLLLFLWLMLAIFAPATDGTERLISDVGFASIFCIGFLLGRCRYTKQPQEKGPQP